ncbi:MAG: glycoside hydrolase family 15 protein [Nitrospirota bacterium]
MRSYKRLEDYGIIGDLDTCALVGNDGSIDWCCLPHVESPSVFAALLDRERGGRFSITPVHLASSEQRYVDRTTVLKTTFRSNGGEAEVVDFMLPKEIAGNEAPVEKNIYRKVSGRRGVVSFAVELSPRFDYGRAPTVFEQTEGGILAASGEARLYLESPVPLRITDEGGRGTFTIKDGETLWFVLGYGSAPLSMPVLCDEVLHETVRYWEGWMHKCTSGRCLFEGPWHELIIRSSLVLKLLAHNETGAISAAPTTSLPEVIGGVRNWDYRYNWLRDASFTVQAFNSLGYVREAKAFLRWARGIFTRLDPEQIKPLYGLHGGVELREEELPHLSGYRCSRPVRIGNAAHRQLQLDIFGELIEAVYDATRYGVEIPPDAWFHLDGVIDYVCFNWKRKDHGIWEPRCAPRHYTHSKLMCWVALDRGIRIVEKLGMDANTAHWKSVQQEIRQAIETQGFSRRLNSFVQHFDGEELDASSLLIPLMEFLPFDDPRVQGTIDAVKQNLMRNGFVYRYLTDDGLPGREGCFILCSFWLVDALALSGRREEALEVFSTICSHASPLGLLAEEIDPDTGEQLGNYPQAYSHIGLINSALYLGKAFGKEQRGPEPVGTEAG